MGLKVDIINRSFKNFLRNSSAHYYGSHRHC
jgi:hypothetical protein